MVMEFRNSEPREQVAFRGGHVRELCGVLDGLRWRGSGRVSGHAQLGVAGALVPAKRDLARNHRGEMLSVFLVC